MDVPDGVLVRHVYDTGDVIVRDRGRALPGSSPMRLRGGASGRIEGERTRGMIRAAGRAFSHILEPFMLPLGIR